MANDETSGVLFSSSRYRLSEYLRRKEHLTHWLAVGVFGAALLALPGCATTGAYTAPPRPPPVRVGAIVEWSKADVPTATIIRRIRRSGTVYHVNVGEMITLHNKGVANIVLDYMQATYLDAVSRNRARMDLRRWHRYNDGYYYGGVGYGWEQPSFNFGEFGDEDGGGDEGN